MTPGVWEKVSCLSVQDGETKKELYIYIYIYTYTYRLILLRERERDSVFFQKDHGEKSLAKSWGSAWEALNNSPPNGPSNCKCQSRDCQSPYVFEGIAINRAIRPKIVQSLPIMLVLFAGGVPGRGGGHGGYRSPSCPVQGNRDLGPNRWDSIANLVNFSSSHRAKIKKKGGVSADSRKMFLWFSGPLILWLSYTKEATGTRGGPLLEHSSESLAPKFRRIVLLLLPWTGKSCPSNRALVAGHFRGPKMPF